MAHPVSFLRLHELLGKVGRKEEQRGIRQKVRHRAELRHGRRANRQGQGQPLQQEVR